MAAGRGGAPLLFLSIGLKSAVKRSFFCSAGTKASASPGKTANPGPGSHNYVPGVKGYAPNIYPPRGISFVRRKKPKYPDLRKTAAEPKSKDEKNTWRSEMKALRRRYLTEYVVEQKKRDSERKQRKKKTNEATNAHESALCAQRHHRYSVPTIRSLVQDDYPLSRPDKLEQVMQKRKNDQTAKDKDKMERLHHFLTLYSHSGKFIASMEELDLAVNSSFQEVPTGSPPSYGIQLLYDRRRNSFVNSRGSVHPEIYDALLGTVDGGKLGPDELMKLCRMQDKGKSNTQN